MKEDPTPKVIDPVEQRANRLPPTHPKANQYRLMNETELAELACDIAAHGQYDACIVSGGPASEGLLIDGRNRWLACERVGIEPEVHSELFEDEESIISYIESKNDFRRHLTDEEQQANREERIARVVAGRREGKSIRTIAKEEGVSPGQVQRDIKESGVSPDTPEKVTGADGKTYQAKQDPRPKDHNATADLHPPAKEEPRCSRCKEVKKASSLGWSAGQLVCRGCRALAPEEPTKQEALFKTTVKESVEASFQKAGPLDSKTLLPKAEVRSPAEKAAYWEQVDQNRKAKSASIAEEARDLASSDRLGPFSVLYADPPWHYDAKVSEAKAIQYPTLPIEELCKIPVQNITAPKAVLYLWVTAPQVQEALQLITAWGFVYKTHYVWIKGVNGSGMGFWARIDHELLFVATKGNFPTPSDEQRISSVFTFERRGHSEKPNEVREHLEKLYPDHPRVELFAREEAPGWTSIGNEIDGRDIFDVLADRRQMGLPRAATPKAAPTEPTTTPLSVPLDGSKRFEECNTKEEVEALWEERIDQATNDPERELIGRLRADRLRALASPGEPGPWLSRALARLEQTVNRKDFDDLYLQLIATAVTPEEKHAFRMAMPALRDKREAKEKPRTLYEQVEGWAKQMEQTGYSIGYRVRGGKQYPGYVGVLSQLPDLPGEKVCAKEKRDENEDAWQKEWREGERFICCLYAGKPESPLRNCDTCGMTADLTDCGPIMRWRCPRHTPSSAKPKAPKPARKKGKNEEKTSKKGRSK